MVGDPLYETIAILASGTTSASFHRPGYRLVGLVLPSMDSTTIQFAVSVDDSTFVDVYTNSGTPAAATLGTASTGARVQAVPEEIGRLAAVLRMRLVVASQTGGARAIIGMFQKA